MKGSVNVPSSRTEFFFENAPITVLSQEAQEDSSQSLQFARQIAALKNVQSYNDPFYVMDMTKVNQLVEQWCCSLPRVQPYYSLNCNKDAVLLKLLASNRYVGFNCINNQNVEDASDTLEEVSKFLVPRSPVSAVRVARSRCRQESLHLLAAAPSR